MKLDDTFTLLTAGAFSSPTSATDVLPYPFGAFDYSTTLPGGWACPCIDKLNFRYAIAAFPVPSAAAGNTFTVYVDGAVVTSGFTVSPDVIFQGQRIALLKFTADPAGAVAICCQGYARRGVVLTNPVDIVRAILDLAGFDGKLDEPAWEQARQTAAAKGYTASGVLLTSRTLREIGLEILGSFQGILYDAWGGAATVALLTGLQGNPPIDGVISLGDWQEVTAKQQLAAACNQAVIRYAGAYTQTDKRTTTGLAKDRGYLGEITIADAASQQRYNSIQRREFLCPWIVDATVAAAVGAEIVALFGTPPWVLTGYELSTRNLAVQVGRYLAFSWAGFQDETGQSLLNQIGYILDHEVDLNTGKNTLQVQDTGRYLYSMILAMGLARANGAVSAGAQREIRRF